MDSLDRRTLLRAFCGGLVGTATIAPGIANSPESVATATFDDQTTDGRTVLVAVVRTSVDATYTLTTVDHAITFAKGELPAGTDVEGFTVSLDRPLTRDRVLKFALYPSGGGSVLAKDTARVTLAAGVEYVEGLSVTRIEADPDFGFQWPYFLYAPPIRNDGRDRPVLVEPNNTGSATDDFEIHEREANGLIERGISRQISDQLGVPFLVPVFPRPVSDPVDWTHYVHQLDRDTLQLSSGPLARIDRQLLRMVDHARQRLEDESFPVGEKILLNGFSASGNFVERFTVLHPDRVSSVTAGGLNGMVLLPIERAKGHTLRYPVGVADVETITGDPIDLAALADVDQFFYMGGDDENDTIPFDDAWTSDTVRETALAVYGENMIKERFPYCQQAYERRGIEAQFRIYEGVGHDPAPATADIIEFHRRSIAGEDVSTLGQDVGVRATFDVTPNEPIAGVSVTFDASESRTNTGEILSYTWDFDDGGSAAGPIVTHTFTEPGPYTVTFEFVDDVGWVESASVTLSVAEAPDESDGDGPTETTDAPEKPAATVTSPTTAPDPTDPVDRTSGGTPGFGIPSTLAALVGAGYLLKRRFDADDRT
jgi:PGF-CTERM protein